MTDLVELERKENPVVEKTDMEQTIELLSQTELDVNQFYCISIRKNNISFQGNYNSEVARKLTELGYAHRIDKAGYIHFESEKIEVILT